MKKGSAPKVIASLLMLILAGYFGWSWWNDNRDQTPQTYFYDLSEKKLFIASLDAVPPILGTDQKVEDGMRAVVYSPSGDCEKDQQIAYLEKYSPELKRQFEASKANPNADIQRMPRSMTQSHTFVRRVHEEAWHAMDSEEGGKIVGEWQANAAPGTIPTICVP